MRVRVKGGPKVKVGLVISLTLLNEPERGLAKVEVVWVKRVAFRTRVIGLRFVDLTEEAHEVILRSLRESVGTMGRATGAA